MAMTARRRKIRIEVAKVASSHPRQPNPTALRTLRSVLSHVITNPNTSGFTVRLAKTGKLSFSASSVYSNF